MKKIWIGLAVVVVVIVAAVVFLYSSLDGIVKTAIEKVGSEVAGVKVSVEEVKISLGEGKGTIRGLTVGNPSGFTAPSAFRLGEISLTLDTGSVTKNPVVIRSISVSAPEVTYELNSAGDNNLSAIENNLKRSSSSASGGASSSSANKSASSDDGKKLIVSKLDITKGKVGLATPIAGGATSVTLPDIHLTNLGSGGQGLSPQQLATTVLDSLTQTAARTAATASLGQALKGVLGSGSQAAGSAASGVVEGLKGVLGK